VEQTEKSLSITDLEKIFQSHHGLVFRAAFRVTGDASDAEDVLQTVFLRLVRRPPEADGVRGLESYLYRSAINTALDILRSRARKTSIPLDEQSPAAIAGAASSPDREVASAELREWLRMAISRLSPRSAEMIVLRFFEGKDNPEIARMLETTPSTVAVTLHRARERLQREFQVEMGGMS
jgi:RNA polymerase sigma-70 factor (ECF subfamily)